MTTTPIRGPLTRALDDPRSPVRLFLEERFPDVRAIQRRYRENAPAQVVPGNEANPGTVGTACDWLLRFLVHPQPDVHLALMGGGFVPQHGPGLGVALFEMCDTLGIPTGGTMPPARASTPTFTGPVPGSTIEPDLLARGCSALALLTAFYRARPARLQRRLPDPRTRYVRRPLRLPRHLAARRPARRDGRSRREPSRHPRRLPPTAPGWTARHLTGPILPAVILLAAALSRTPERPG